MIGCADARPLLAARQSELDPETVAALVEHVDRCPLCATEAAGFARLARGLVAMAAVELEPPAGSLDAALAAVAGRPATWLERAMPESRVAVVAAGSAGALVATLVVARALHGRRRGPAAGTAHRRSRPALGRPVERVLAAGE